MDYTAKSHTAVYMINQLTKFISKFNGLPSSLRDVIDDLDTLILEYSSLPDTKKELHRIDSITLNLEEIYSLTLDHGSNQINKDNTNRIIELADDLKIEISKLKDKIRDQIIIGSVGSMSDFENNKKHLRIVQDKVSGGYLLSIYRESSNDTDSKDEWFDTYEELEAYFKRNNLQVDWLNSD